MNKNQIWSGTESGAQTNETSNRSRYPVCEHCGSPNVARDAWAQWSTATGAWELGSVFDRVYCFACSNPSHLKWLDWPASAKYRIRLLNDALRQGLTTEGQIVVSTGIETMGRGFVSKALEAVAAFSEFNADNDPHGEHDFGSLKVEEELVFFKIDYYDRKLMMHSPDAADPSVTCRVMTFMLASEY